MTTEQGSFFATEEAPPKPTLRAVPTSIVLSAPLKVDLVIYCGDSGSFRIRVKNPNGTPMDVSTATWDADIREDPESPTVLTTFDIVPVPGDNSAVDVVLSATKSAMLEDVCVYDVEMTLNAEVRTLVAGKITMTYDVSRPQ